MTRSKSSGPQSGNPPRVRRAYFECRFGQLHVRYAVPAGGGFDEATTLLCFHQSPMSARTFDRFLPEMARDRSVYAIDTPGYGGSDAPATPPAIADYAAAMRDFVETMRFRKVDLLGYHTGTLIAAQLALACPEQVRRLVLVGLPLLNEPERAAFRKTPATVPIAEDGSHLLKEWQASMQWRAPGISLESIAASFAEKLHNGPNAGWGSRAVMEYPAVERLHAIKQPTLVLRCRDHLWEASARAKGVLRTCTIIDLPQAGFGLFDVMPEKIAATCREFLAGD